MMNALHHATILAWHTQNAVVLFQLTYGHHKEGQNGLQFTYITSGQSTLQTKQNEVA